MSRLTREGTTEPVSRDRILRREGGQGNIHFPCPADHVRDWQPYPVDPYSCYMYRANRTCPGEVKRRKEDNYNVCTDCTCTENVPGAQTYSFCVLLFSSCAS